MSGTAYNDDASSSPTKEEGPQSYYEKNSENSSDQYDQYEEVHELARQVTSQSVHTSGGELVNPFIDSTDPALNPNSEKFNSKSWMRHVLNISSRDPENHPPLTAGVAFKNLGAYGFGTSADYQKTVANITLELFTLAKKVTGLQQKTKIQILQNFHGLVKCGETCMVLGRPGR
jgi:ATP-binding cassette subfamily G (WHITE) protein 2 (PDR)